MNISAAQLQGYLENGATLKSHWKPRYVYFQKPKMLYELTLPSGEMLSVQKSAVDALIYRKIIRSYPVVLGTVYKLLAPEVAL